MRKLTSSEAEVVGALLARIPGGDRELIQRTGVPRTTLQRVRRTALREGWLARTEIPSLSAAGIGRVRISVIHPFAEFHSAAAAEWTRRDDVALFWDLGESLLAITCSAPPRPTPSKSVPMGTPAREWVRAAHSVTLTFEEGSCPVFFDFEGLWARTVLNRAPTSYPRGLEFRPPNPARPAPAGAHGALRRRLATNSPSGHGAALTPPWVALRERRWHRWLVEAGWVEPRFVLSPWALPTVPGVPEPSFVFLLGRRRAAGAPLAAFSQLRDAAGLHPFLYAEDPERVILGAMASRGSAPGRPGSVLETAQTYLQNLEIVRVPVERVRTLVRFRFPAFEPGE